MSPRKRPRKEIQKRNPLERIELPQKDNMESFQTLMVVLFFASAFFTLFHFVKLDLSLIGLTKLYCLFLGISFLIPISLYRRKFTMSIYEYILFNLLTFSTMILAFSLLLNASFPTKKYKESYKIISSKQTEVKITYQLQNGAYEDQEYIRSINEKDKVEIFGQDSLSIYFTDGLFGIRIIERKELH